MAHDDADRPRHGRRSRRERRRKERILHTRISEELEEDLRRAAEELRVPVSNLVRNVLEEAVTVVEAVSDEFGELIEDVVEGAEEVAQRLKGRHGRSRDGARRWTEAARSARARATERSRASHEAERAAPAPPPRGRDLPILGWQPLVLDRAARCGCGRELPAGSQAHVALTSAGFSERYRCDDCVRGIGGAAEDGPIRV